MTSRHTRTKKMPDSDGNFKCSECHEWLPPTAYNKDKRQANGISYRCRNCSRTSIRKYNLRAKYNLEVGEYNILLEKSQGQCTCCSKRLHNNAPHPEDRPIIDHDHKTGKVRAILCNHCNRMVGYLREDPKYTMKLLDYIQGYCL